MARLARAVAVAWAALGIAAAAYSIPVIDLAPLFDDSSQLPVREEVGRQVVEAFRQHGIFYAVGHGLDAAAQESAFDDARTFFGLPDAHKQACASKPGAGRGYIGIGAESGTPTLLEYKESFSYGYPWDPARPPENSMQAPNVWPPAEAAAAAGKEWRHRMLSTFSGAVRAVEAVARATSLGLGWGEHRLAELCSGAETIAFMRAFHYLPREGHSSAANGTAAAAAAAAAAMLGAAEAVVGSSPHTDWGLLTAIAQDGVGGLQYWDDSAPAVADADATAATGSAAECAVEADGTVCGAAGPAPTIASGSSITSSSGSSGGAWVDVPPKRGALVVLCGDFLRLLSGARLASPLHRVAAARVVPRLSYVLFYYPAFDTRLRDVEEGGGGGGGGGEVRVQVAPEGFVFNTLLDAASLEEVRDMRFGEYLEAKWMGVALKG